MTFTGSKIELLSLKEASKVSPYSADYLNLLARKGKIGAVKIGRDWLVPRENLFEYLKRQEEESKNKLKALTKYIKK